ncbi:MAG: hypothetical protein A2Z29_01415 [Chloroflexi bacterium RBG_16_56_11]|nr:MAG: hypothetical protein A2Z29_01415 [Chloroflexi bacterium RBG_16_56_11]
MKKLTSARLLLAIISTGAEEVAIWAVWRWLLPEAGIYLPVALLVVVMVGWAGIAAWLFVFTSRTLKKDVPAGLPSMVGTTGRVASDLDPEGLVKIGGELWGAVSTGGDIYAGAKIVVVAQDGLKLFVSKMDGDGVRH